MTSLPRPRRDLRAFLQRILVGGVAATLLATGSAISFPQAASASGTGLTATPVTWDVLGLDSNNVSAGPNVYPMGQKVCNTSSSSMSGVSAALVFDTANTYINATGPTTVSVGTLAPGACALAYFTITITRNAAAYNASRRYHVDVTATGGYSASSPTPRQFYVQKLVSQNRNGVDSISGSSIDTTTKKATVYVGQTYTFTGAMHTATNGYQQIFTPVVFPTNVFKINSTSFTYSAPTNGTNNQPYADGCGWIADPTNANYLSCGTSSTNYGGTIGMTYNVTVIGTGTGILSAMVNDNSGGSFHYNSDFGTGVDAVPFTALQGPALSLALANNSPWQRSGSGAITATVTNSGDAATTGAITLATTLPPELTFASSVTAGWTCAAAGQVVTCTRSASLAAAASSAVVLGVTVSSSSGTPLAVSATADTSGSAQATASSSPTVIQPLTPPNLTSSGVGTAVQTVTVPTNAGDIVRLLDGSGNPATTVTIGGEGTYSMPSATEISFAPVLGYHGTATPVTYRQTATSSAYGTATYTPTVTLPGGPTAAPLTSSDAFGATQAQTATIPTSGSVTLLDAGNPVITASTADGTYSLDPATGVITFTPVAAFYGSATPADYRVTDAYGQTADGTYTPTVAPPPAPQAPDLTSQAPCAVNETATATIPVGGSVTLIDTDGTTPTTSVVDAQGLYSIDTTSGIITFAPDLGVCETTPNPVTYQVTDAAHQTSQATYSPWVTTLHVPAPPAPPALTSTGPYETTQTVTAAIPGSGGTITLVVPGAGPNGADLETSALAGADGDYSLDPATGAITFTPNNSFVGTSDPVTYRVYDAYGQPGDATYTPTVTPPAYAGPAPITSSGPFNTAQSAQLDVPSDGSVTLLDGLGHATATYTDADGSYALNGSGVVTFTPTNGFTGTATAVPYRATDAYGQSGESTYTPTVDLPAAPTPPAKTSSGPQNTDQTTTLTYPAGGSVRLLTSANISTTTVSNITGTYVLDTLTGLVTYTPTQDFVGQATAVNYRVRDAYGQYGDSTYTPTVLPPSAPAPSPVTSSGPINTAQQQTIVIPNGDSVMLLDAGSPVTTVTTVDGTYTLDPLSGVVTFVPLLNFSGVATPVGFRLSDTYGQHGDSTYTPTVFAAAPVPAALTSSGPKATPQTVTATVPAGDTVTLLDGTASPVTTVTTADGAYSIDTTTGVITFTPGSTFTGTATPVTYQLTDGDAQTGTNTYTPTVVPPPTALPLTSSGAGTTLQAATATVPIGGGVTLLDGGGQPATTMTITGQGVYSVDTSTGTLHFQPEFPFQGVATPVSYRLSDSYGQTDTSSYTPTVTPPGAPVAVPLTSTGEGTALQSAAPTVPTSGSVTLLVQGSPATDLTLPHIGTYHVDAVSGILTFSPVYGYAGAPAPATYQLTDAYGSTVSSTYSPLVTPPAPPAPPTLTSSGVGTQEHKVSVAVPLQGSVTLIDGSGNWVTSLTVPGVGIYVLDPTTGMIVFQPVSGFSGQAPAVTYAVTDAYGQTTDAIYVATVTLPAPPQPVPSFSTTAQNGSRQSVHLPSDGMTCTLRDASGATVASVTIAGVGTYTIDSVTCVLSFDAVKGFVGTAPGVTYALSDGYGRSVEATYVAHVTATAAVKVTVRATARPLTVLRPAAPRTVPVTCRITNDTQKACTVTLVAVVHGSPRTIGVGSTAVRKGRTSVVVPVRLRPLGIALAAQVGGVKARAVAQVVRTSGGVLITATKTRIVAHTIVLRPVFFDTASSALHAGDKHYLDTIRPLLGGVVAVTCDGYTDSRADGGYNRALGLARARSACSYLLRTRSIGKVFHSYGENHPFETNGTVPGRASNRRTELRLSY